MGLKLQRKRLYSLEGSGGTFNHVGLKVPCAGMSLSVMSLTSTSKNKTPVLGNAIPGYEPKTGEVGFLVSFQHRSMFSHINGKLSPRPFK